MREFTKSEKRKLRELASEAHARELHEALRDLDSLFSEWRARHIDGFELANAIHEYHNGPDRELYSQYSRLDPGFLVARAVARRLLERREVPPKILETLSGLIEYCAEFAEEPET